MSILFITRTYPPAIGGMENYSYNLYQNLAAHRSVTLRANRRGKKALPWFLLTNLVWLLLHGRRYRHLHFGDAVLAPLAYWAHLVTSSRVSCTVHALDITYPNTLYQLVVPWCLKRIDTVICVSRYTREECLQRGIQEEKLAVIPNALDFRSLPSPSMSIRKSLVTEFLLDNKKILLSVGRLVSRKGLDWFVSKVMPRLPDEYVLLVAGDGVKKRTIQAAIKDNRLETRVYLLGTIKDSRKATLYDLADLFIMPNIRIAGDAEGFGISIIEAAAYGTPAIAANLEGIRDAVLENITGTLVESANVEAYTLAIQRARFDPESVKAACRQNYDWSATVRRYLEIFAEPD